MNYQPIDAVYCALFTVTAFTGACAIAKTVIIGHNSTAKDAGWYAFGLLAMFGGLFGLFMVLMGF